eukprot:scaffold45403_cov57-Attheya_sp.AAC.2
MISIQEAKAFDYQGSDVRCTLDINGLPFSSTFWQNRERACTKSCNDGAALDHLPRVRGDSVTC